MRQLVTSITKVPLRAVLIGGLCLGATACASQMTESERMSIEAAKTDAASAKADATRALGIMEEVKATNEMTMQASKDAAAAAAEARDAADRAAKIAAQLEALYNKQLRK